MNVPFLVIDDEEVNLEWRRLATERFSFRALRLEFGGRRKMREKLGPTSTLL